MKIMIDYNNIVSKYSIIRNESEGKNIFIKFGYNSLVEPFKSFEDIKEKYWSFLGNDLSFYDEKKTLLYILKPNYSLSSNYRNEFVFFSGINNIGQTITAIVAKHRIDVWLYTTRFLMNDEINQNIVDVKEHSYGKFFVGDHGPSDKILIGDYVQFGINIRFITRNHRTDLVSSFPFDELSIFLDKDIDNKSHISKNNGIIKVGNDVWIGDNSLILGGVTIGDGAVIGAGSIVTKDVPDYAIVAGNPAKLIRYRFSPEQIAKLKKIAWWNWDDETVANNLNKITSDNIDAFIDEFYKE